MKDSPRKGALFVVATPIGNLGDISSRAVQALTDVDLVASEDTRHTRKLLSHLGINTALTSYYREKEQKKAPALLNRLLEGQNIAIVSDAGTPGISDPGAVLVRMAREAGIKVIPIPGPSALTAALSVAGLQDSSFYFAGFLPAKKGVRRKQLKSLAGLPCPIVFYESPHRIKTSLVDCLACLGDRNALLFRELTKIHEQCLAGNLSHLRKQVEGGVKGELVLIIQPLSQPAEEKPENLDELICWYRDKQTISMKDAVRRIATDLDLSRSAVYQQALNLWKKENS